jgi:hypothetical protein
MYQDVLLFLPPTHFSAERMGIDFDLPISQVRYPRFSHMCACVLPMS